jgi:hypothetical protein
MPLTGSATNGGPWVADELEKTHANAETSTTIVTRLIMFPILDGFQGDQRSV